MTAVCGSADAVAFDSPASRWEEALPLGNGRLGAMVFGVPDREKIQLNEDSVWSGAYRDRNNPAAKDALPLVRRLLNEGRFREAEELCLETFSGVPPAQRVYQTAGDLLISFSPDAVPGGFGHPSSGTRCGPLFAGIRNYRRELDMERSLHTVSFEYEGVVFTRECFVAAESGVFMLRFSAAESGGKLVRGRISFRASLDRGVFYDRSGNVKDASDTLFLARDGDIPFCVMMKAVTGGGELCSRGGFLTVLNADEALLFVDIRTGFRENDWFSACASSLNNAAAMDWQSHLRAHEDGSRALYRCLELKLDGGDAAVRYYNFCRYALFSCSRPGTLPANLQGLWNPHLDPPWGSDYTININTQMNYWPACMCSMAETEEPLFDLLERMYPNGKKTAELMYGCRGFTAHHNTDIWGDTAPRDYWIPASYWTLGAAWLSLHVFEHYEYTLDKKFLEKYFYLLQEACIFFTDFLVPGAGKNEKGEPYLVVVPSSSPENSFVHDGDTASLCAGCAMDSQILRKLFDVTVRGAEILGIADNDTVLFRSVLGRIPPPEIHSTGVIREWNEEYEEAEPGHRHFSHLWALWPGDTWRHGDAWDPALAAAARKTLETRLARSGGHTGWSRAWLVNLFARLHDGDAAFESLSALWDNFTLPNLLNNGPPFQIDGNFGALAGMTQLLFQSRLCPAAGGRYNVVLDLLPALPPCWPNGSLKGARAKGNIGLDFAWQGGKVTSLVIRNYGKDAICVTLRVTGSGQREITLSPGEAAVIS